jgi:hypothetical protein
VPGGPLLWASLRWDEISGPAPLGLWSCTPLGWSGRRAAAMLRAAWRRCSVQRGGVKPDSCLPVGAGHQPVLSYGGCGASASSPFAEDRAGRDQPDQPDQPGDDLNSGNPLEAILSEHLLDDPSADALPAPLDNAGGGCGPCWPGQSGQRHEPLAEKRACLSVLASCGCQPFPVGAGSQLATFRYPATLAARRGRLPNLAPPPSARAPCPSISSSPSCG